MQPDRLDAEFIKELGEKRLYVRHTHGLETPFPPGVRFEWFPVVEKSLPLRRCGITAFH